VMQGLPTKAALRSLLMAILASCFLAFAAPPVTAAKLPLTQSECEAAGMMWRPQVGKCKNPRKIGKRRLSAFEQALGVLGSGRAILALWLVWQSPAKDDS
jgi:hypothetical protein